jgi:hypothetical protein
MGGGRANGRETLYMVSGQNATRTSGSPIDLQAGHGQLRDGKVDVNGGVGGLRRGSRHQAH